MGLQVVVAREALVTHFALEGFFTGMRALVVLQHVFVTETSVASLASEDFVFACVV